MSYFRLFNHFNNESIMIKYCQIGAMLILVALCSSLSVSAATDKLKCKGCVGSKDLAKNAVTGDKIKNGSVSIKDLSRELQNRIKALEETPKANVEITAPTVNDDINSGYPEGSVWIDMSQNQAYILLDSTPGTAVWKHVTDHGETYAIGDTGPAGGIVFYTTDGGTRGMEVAPVDQSTSAPWGCDGFSTGISGTAIGMGALNTEALIFLAPALPSCSGETAARIADDYTLNGYTDWFLPSIDELNLINLCESFCGLNNIIYWSSSETINIGGSRIDPSEFEARAAEGGVLDPFPPPFNDLKISLNAVRAVRTF